MRRENLVLVGTSHKKCPVCIREKLSLTSKAQEKALALLFEFNEIKGVLVLSTCNRIEFYASVTDPSKGMQKIKEFIYEYYETNYIDLEPYLYSYANTDAIRHLFNVASGLDSQVLGETQILGQVRDAYNKAKVLEVTDVTINRYFTEAMRVGRAARKKTSISKGSTSVGSVAIDLIKRSRGSLSGKKILIIGVGKVSSLVAKYLQKENADAVFISNRTYEKAVKFAEQINGKAVKFNMLKQYLIDADIIISTTACPCFILDTEDFTKYKKSLLIVDLAVPRDVSPDVGNLDGIQLLCMDDLDEVIEGTLAKKKESAIACKSIIEKEIKKLEDVLFPASLSNIS